jgi:hypothetical protein
MASVQVKNGIALACVGAAKVCGIGGVAAGFAHQRALAVTLMSGAGVLLALAVTICILVMKDQAQEETTDKAILERMMREGTLKQYLADLQVKEKNHV